MKRLCALILLVFALVPARSSADEFLEKASPEKLRRLRAADQRMEDVQGIFPALNQITQIAGELRRRNAILLQAPKNIERGDLDLNDVSTEYIRCIEERGSAAAGLRAALTAYKAAIEDNRRTLSASESGQAWSVRWRRSFDTRMQREKDVGTRVEELAASAEACQVRYRKLDIAMKTLRKEANDLKGTAETVAALAGRLIVEKARLDSASENAVTAGWFLPVAGIEFPATVADPIRQISEEARRLAVIAVPGPADAGVLKMDRLLEGLLEKVDDATRAADADAYLHLLPRPQQTCSSACYDLAGDRAQQRAQVSAAVASLQQMTIGLVPDDSAALALGKATTADRAGINQFRTRLLPAIAEGEVLVARVTTQAASWSQALNEQYRRSITAAADEREAALTDIYPEGTRVFAPVVAPDPLLAPAGMSGIVRHVYQLVKALDMEAPAKARTPAGSFGSYTYVFLRGPPPFEKDNDALRRYQKLLALLCAEPEGATVPADLKRESNLFVLAGESGTCMQVKQFPVPYQGDLGNQWKMRAQHILANKRMRGILANSSGPFLLTLPTRINLATADTPALFADLSRYKPAAVSDLVAQYKNGLLSRFPADQAQWQPTTQLKVALTMISLANDAGGLAFKLFPAREARAGH